MKPNSPPRTIPALNLSLSRTVRLRLLLVLLVGFPLVLWQTALWTERLARAQIQDQGEYVLSLYSAHIRRELEKFELLPRILATHPDIRELLLHPNDPATVSRVNGYLKRINTIAQASVTYVLDRNGTALATSNWDQPLSFMGIRLDYRPYFRQAMKGEVGRFFGMGTTSNQRGYYFAAPVAEEGMPIGAVVIKVGVERFESPGQWGRNRVAIADERGVIFISSEPEWSFRTLEPLDPETLTAIRVSLQYNDVTLQPLPVADSRRVAEGRVLTIGQDADPPGEPSAGDGAGRFLVQSVPLPKIGWDLYVFSDMAPVSAAVLLASSIAVLLLIITLLTGLYWVQRRASIQEKLAAQEALQWAHDNLESKVRDRTAELHASNQRLQREIEERKQAESGLIQAGKLAALGQLSTGIVHELSQPLAAIRTYADNARAFLERNDRDHTRANLVLIGELIQRIAGITSRLKSFARKTPDRVEPVSVERAIRYALSLLESKCQREGIQVELDLPAEDIPVWGEAIRLEQVMVNLLKNAVEAMAGQEEPGQLHINARVLAGRVEITVRDTGPGIADADLVQVLDPFFTTKPAGEGLGLGLSISNKIVREFGGSIQAANHEQGGAVFTVTLQQVESSQRSQSL